MQDVIYVWKHLQFAERCPLHAQVWTRQIVLTLIDVILTKNFLLSSMSTSAAAYIQAGTNAIFLAIACALNQRYRPYKDQVLPNLSQNALEGGLLAVSSVQALLSCLHFATKDTGGGTGKAAVSFSM